MTDEQQRDQQGGDQGGPTEKLLLHLLRHPYDLVDTRRLMRRFRASAAETQEAIGKLEQLLPKQAEKVGC